MIIQEIYNKPGNDTLMVYCCYDDEGKLVSASTDLIVKKKIKNKRKRYEKISKSFM